MPFNAAGIVLEALKATVKTRRLLLVSRPIGSTCLIYLVSTCCNDLREAAQVTPQTDMPLASGRGTGASSPSAPYQMPLSNTRPPYHQNSAGTCCVQRVAQ